MKNMSLAQNYLLAKVYKYFYVFNKNNVPLVQQQYQNLEYPALKYVGQDQTFLMSVHDRTFLHPHIKNGMFLTFPRYFECKNLFI